MRTAGWNHLGSCGVLLAAVALGGCSSLPAMPKDSSFGVTAQYWMASPDGHAYITAGSKPGTATNVRLDNDLGLDSERILDWSAFASFGDHRFTAEYLPLSFSGSDTASHDYLFHGATYPAGDRTSADLNLDTWVLKWDMALWKQKKSEDALRVGLGAWFWKFDLHLKGTPSGNNETRQFHHLYPGVHGDWVSELGGGATLDLKGAIAATGLEKRLYDWSAEIAYPLSDALKLGIGYRWLRWDFDESTNDGDYSIRGPYAALSLRF